MVPSTPDRSEIPVQAVGGLERSVCGAQGKLAEDVEAPRDVLDLPVARRGLVLLHVQDDDVGAVELVGEAGVEETVIGSQTNVAVSAGAHGLPLEVRVRLGEAVVRALFQWERDVLACVGEGEVWGVVIFCEGYMDGPRFDRRSGTGYAITYCIARRGGTAARRHVLSLSRR